MIRLRNLWSALSSAVGLFAASLEAARAVRAHHQPQDATLNRLGIRRESFPSSF